MLDGMFILAEMSGEVPPDVHLWFSDCSVFYDNRLLFIIWHLLRRFVDRHQWNECQLGWCEHRRGLQTGQDLELWVSSLQMKWQKMLDWHLVIELQVREAERTTDTNCGYVGMDQNHRTSAVTGNFNCTVRFS